jgi:alpha 1,2-mannosyltransferase
MVEMLLSSSLFGCRLPLILVFLIVGFNILWLRNFKPGRHPPPGEGEEVRNHTSITQDTVSSFRQLIPFWRKLATSLESARPTCGPVTIYPPSPGNDDFFTYEPLFPNKPIPDRLKNFTGDQEHALFLAHYAMRNSAQRLGPSLPFDHDTTGIVTTAGAEYVPVLLVSLRMLRRTGCQLPVEVFLDSHAEYNVTLCEEILPSLNAHCRILLDIYNAADNAAPPKHFQYKVFSILFSSFQKVLFLDADAFPAHDPTPLFKNAPFTTHGLITWPDFWANSASAHYYHIAGFPEVPPATRYASESGQLMLDKEKHRQSLLMMVYYNYYGPDYYYPLFSQGGPGTGDKDTFLAAAMAVDAPFYQVKRPIWALGRWGPKKEGVFDAAAMAQADPMEDFEYKAPHRSHIHKKAEWGKDDVSGEHQKEQKFLGGHEGAPRTPRPFFVHCSMNKLDPAKVLHPFGKAFTSDGRMVRIYTTEDDGRSVIEAFGYDFEKRVWESIAVEACRTDEKLCGRVKKYFKTVFGD